MNASRGEIIDNVGQRSPRSGVYGIENVNESQGEVIDINGLQSPRSGVFGIDNMSGSRGVIIDNDGLRSPWSNQGEYYDMNVFRGEVIDIVGQRSPQNEDIPRPLEPGAGTSSINFSQSVTQILASLGKDGYVNPRQGLAVISAYTDTWKETMTARFNSQEERILALESQL